MRWRPVTALAVVLVALVAACGVPTDAEPRAIETRNVPFQLLAPTVEAPTTTQPANTATERATIYLADADGKLQAVRRPVTAPATAKRVLEALLAGPTEEEADRFATAITSDTQLLGVDGPDNGLVIVDLSRQLLDITGRSQILALAQVVFTVTALPSVDRVLFKFEGQPAEVQNGNGTLTSSPLGRLSYRDLVP